MIKLVKNNFVLVSLLLVGCIVFIYSYWNNIYHPGALFDQGWYSIWADQRRYYEQAKAISQFQLNADNFYYPILYPLLGSLFIRFIPADPFFVVNLVLFLTTVSIFYMLIVKVFSTERAILGVFLLLSVNRFTYDFVTPWTTSITTPLFLATYFILLTKSFSSRRLILISIFTGLAALARYSDIFFFLPLVGAYILKNKNFTLKTKTKYGIVAFGILSVFAVLFIVINLNTSGNILGPYIQRLNTNFGIELAPLTIFEKIFGFVLNPYIFHRQNEFFSTPLFVAMPFIFFLLVFAIPLIRVLIRKQSSEKTVHIALFLSFLVWLISYIPHGAIAPYTLKNLAIHYAKHWYPLVIFYGFYVIDLVLLKKQLDKTAFKFILCTVFVFIVLPLSVELTQPKLLNQTRWDITTTVNSKDAHFIFDNNQKTFWNSKRPRKTNDTILIDLKSEHLISRLRIFDTVPFAATNFDTLLSIDGIEWKKLARNYTYNVRREDGWEIVGYMKKGRYIKLLLNEESLTDAWQINELQVFGY